MPYNMVLRVLANTLKQEKEIRHTDWKGRNKITSTCIWHNCLCIKSKKKKSTKKLLELINGFDNIVG